MEEKIVQVGVFWAVPNASGWGFYEVKKAYPVSSADALGFIDYPFSHYDKWEDVRSNGDVDDCYYYPRGRVIYDTKQNAHRIFADEALSECDLEEVLEAFAIEAYALYRDEHYVSAFTNGKIAEPVLSYTVLRGKDKIGENLIEVSYESATVLIELGRALEGGDEPFEQAVLQKPYAAVVVTHYHEDHAGLIKYKRDCPVYIGCGAYRILQAQNEYRGEALPENIRTYRSGRAFTVGGIRITPYLCDHSAFDSYMLLFEAGGKRILYTGDFRFHGRKDKDRLLAVLPREVDVLIHEGTNLGKVACTITEAELEAKAVEIMREEQGPVFVLQSSTNIDRLVSIYRASKRCGRLLYMDNFTALIAAAAGGRIPRPDAFPDVIAFTPRPVRGRRKDMFFEIEHKRGLKGIASGTKHFTMLVRPSMLGYLQKLFAAAGITNATLVYSLWKGYKAQAYYADFLTELQALGVKTLDLHTSGHASEGDIECLKQTVHAKEVVCVHTEGHN